MIENTPERRVVRIAVAQTANVYPSMPARYADLPELADRLDEVRMANVEHHLELMRLARAQGAQAICFGALFSWPYFPLGTEPLWRTVAEDALEGYTVRRVKAAAMLHRMIVVAPIYELDRITGNRFHTAVLIDEEGQVLGKYRQTHVPHGADLEGRLNEGFYYGRSDGRNDVGRTRGSVSTSVAAAAAAAMANMSSNPFFPVFHTSVGRIGILLGYDRHFEGVVWSLRKEGAELIFAPGAVHGEKARRLWPAEFPVDAARHHVFVAAANRKGIEAPWNEPFAGESFVCGPDGPLKDVSGHANLVIADVDLLSLVQPDPSGWDHPRDVRHEIHSSRE